MYADTDFFLALLKEEDWLKRKALAILDEYEGDISSSAISVFELLLLCRRFGMDPEEVLMCMFQIAQVEGIAEHKALCAAHYIKEKDLAPSDALHAALCGGSIISSDKIYDKMGIERIRLER